MRDGAKIKHDHSNPDARAAMYIIGNTPQEKRMQEHQFSFEVNASVEEVWSQA